MARKLATTLVLALGLATALPAEAFWLDAIYCHIETGRAENNAWPQRFVDADRINAQAPFNVMVQNGWRRQNLLGRHHFNEDCIALTDAGKLRVQWILTQPPVHQRQIFVERSFEEGMTESRMATAQDFAAQVLGGNPPTVHETHIVSDGRPATTVNFVNTGFHENMPVPALPESTYKGLDSGN